MSYSKVTDYTHRRYGFTGGDWTIPPWQSQNVYQRNVSETKSGSANPKWREQIRNGANAATSYSRTWWKITASEPMDASILFKYPKFPGGSLVTCEEWFRSSGPWPITGVFVLMPSTPSTAYYATARNQALKYLYNRHADLTHAFQGGVFAGELRETWRMLKSPLNGLKTGILGYLDDVQHRMARDKGFIQRLPKKRRTKWVNDAIADTWLTWALGFKPLCKDIDDAFKALTNLHDRSESFGLTASGSASGLTTSSTVSSPVGNYGRFLVNTIGRETCSVRFKAGFCFSPPEIDERRSLAGQLSLTMADFVPTVWNLIPGSFLYDYVTNIGDVLDAYAHPLVGMTYCVESIKTTLEWQVTTAMNHSAIKSALGTSYVASGGTGGGATAVAGRFERVIPTVLMPTLELDLQLSDRQMLNVAALLQKGNLVRLLTFGAIR